MSWTVTRTHPTAGHPRGHRDRHPGTAQPADAVDHGDPGISRPQRFQHYGPCAGRREGIQRHRVTSQVCGGDVDPRCVGGVQIADERPYLGPGQRNVAMDGPHQLPGETAEILCRDLAQPQRLQDPAGETHQYPEVTGIRTGRHRDRIAQVGGTVGVGRICAAHRPGQHHRHISRIGQFQP